MGLDIMLPTHGIVFPVGNMFWARVDAILPFFTNIQMSDFPKEKGQVDGTIMALSHTLLKGFGYMWLNIMDIHTAFVESKQFYYTNYLYFTFQHTFILLFNILLFYFSTDLYYLVSIIH